MSSSPLIIDDVAASLAMEGLHVSDEDMDIAKQYLDNRLSYDEAKKILIDKYKVI